MSGGVGGVTGAIPLPPPDLGLNDTLPARLHINPRRTRLVLRFFAALVMTIPYWHITLAVTGGFFASGASEKAVRVDSFVIRFMLLLTSNSRSLPYSLIDKGFFQKIYQCLIKNIFINQLDG